MAEANGKRVAIWGAGGVIFLLVVWIVIAAASIGSEASKLDSLLKQDQTSKVSQDQVKKQLTEMGFQISDAPGTNIVATGPHHLAVVYNTWLTVKVDLTPDATANGYNIDRASSWF